MLTSELRRHLSHILEEYHGLQDRASSLAIDSGGKEHDHQLYQRMSSLEPVVSLVRKLEAKEQVRTRHSEQGGMCVHMVSGNERVAGYPGGLE